MSSIQHVDRPLEGAMLWRLSDRLAVSALALFAFGLVVVLVLGGVHVTGEDSFYYFKIGQQIAGGAGSTFDGIHMTNGYHPLWLLCLVPCLVDLFEGGRALSLTPTYDSYARCADRLELLWSDYRYRTSWHFQAYRIRATGESPQLGRER